MSANSTAPSTPCVQCAHADRTCRVRGRNVHCNRCLQKDLDCSFRRNVKARNVDHFLPELISSIEEILQGDFAMLRSIAAGQKELLTLGRAILKEIRKAPAAASEATQRGHMFEGTSSRNVAEDEGDAHGGSEQVANSVRGAAGAESGPVAEDDVHGAQGEGEITGGERKKGKDKDLRHCRDDDAEYVPSSTELSSRRPRRGHHNAAKSHGSDNDEYESDARPPKRKHNAKSTATRSDSPIAGSSRVANHKSTREVSGEDEDSSSAVEEDQVASDDDDNSPRKKLKFGDMDDERREKFQKRRQHRLAREGKKDKVVVKKEKA